MIPRMSVTTFKLGKREYVIVPKKRYDQLTQAEQDRLDGELVAKRREAWRSGKTKAVPLDKAMKSWGL
jgi:hypothetical protein